MQPRLHATSIASTISVDSVAVPVERIRRLAPDTATEPVTLSDVRAPFLVG